MKSNKIAFSLQFLLLLLLFLINLCIFQALLRKTVEYLLLLLLFGRLQIPLFNSLVLRCPRKNVYYTKNSIIRKINLQTEFSVQNQIDCIVFY